MSQSKTKIKSSPRKNIIGVKYGRLTVVELIGNSPRGHIWKCKCECGKEVNRNTSTLNWGNVKSCGCYRKEFRRLSGQTAAKNRLLGNYRNTANQNGVKFSLSDKEFFDLTSSNCHYCGIEPQRVSTPSHHDFRDPERCYIYNGVDKIDPKKGYEKGNVVTACYTCNRAKMAMGYGQFLGWVKRIYLHQYRKTTILTPAQLMDLLFTTNYKLWWAQENLLKFKDSDPMRASQEAVKAQELNAKRTRLIRTIDETLDFSESTNTEKTYSEGKQRESFEMDSGLAGS